MSDSPANGEEQGGVQGDPGGEPVLGQVRIKTKKIKKK